MRVLITKYDGIGDLILFEPAFRHLLEQGVGIEVAVLIREANSGLQQLFELPIHWITTSLNPYADISTGWDEGLLESLATRIDAFKPEQLISGIRRPTWFDGWVTKQAGARVNYSFSQEPLPAEEARMLLERIGGSELPSWKQIAVPIDLPEHEANVRMVGAAFNLPEGEVPRPRLSVPSEREHEADELLATLGLKRGEFVLSAPYGILNNPLKAWSASKHREVLQHLHNKGGWAVLATGASGEQDAMKEFCAGFDVPPPTWMGNAEDLPLYAALIAGSRFYFGNDTGPMHIAAALDIPVFAIFGGGHDQRFHPIGSRTAVVTRPMACFGCEWECAWPVPECLNGLPSEAVIDFLEEWIEGGFASRKFTWNDLGQKEQKVIRLLAEKAEHNRTLRAEYARHRVQLERWLKEAEEDRSARLNILKRCEAELDGALNALDQQRRDCSQLIGQNSQLSAQISELSARNSQLTEQTEQLSARNIELSYEHGQLINQKQALFDEKHRLEERVDAMRLVLRAARESHQLALDLIQVVPSELPMQPQRLLPLSKPGWWGGDKTALRVHFDIFKEETNSLRMAGWVLSKTLEPIAHLWLVVITAKVEWVSPVNLEMRSDVLEKFQVLNEQLRCGFDMIINTGDLPVGAHALRLDGRTMEGKAIRHSISRRLRVEC